MNRNLFRISFLLFMLIITTRSLQATPIVAGQTLIPSRAIQDITLFPGTPFNQSPNPIVFDDLFGDGYLLINRSAQVGSTIAINTLDGLFYGFNPALGSFVFGAISPLTPTNFGGNITNVVQNPLDPGFATGQSSSFQSGNFSFGGNSFGFEFLSGPATGVKLFTDPTVPFSFSSVFDGLPPTPGTVLSNSGPDVLNVLFNGQLVGTSSDRRIIVSVPEPSSMVVFLLGGALGLCGRTSRRFRKA